MIPTISTHLLSLPTEILHQILAPLPTSSLLRFSETSRHARSLANANLHTLSFGIAPLSPPFSTLLHADEPPNSSTSTLNPTTKAPPTIWLRVPNAQTYAYWTLLNFQSALVTSILNRHGAMLQHLEISVWALTLPMACALARLRALRRFALRIERGVVGRAQRSCLAVEREEQEKAWEMLTRETPVWSRRLLALELENCDLDVGQLAGMLGGGRSCAELRLGRCRYLGRGLWDFLARWRARGELRVVGVADCGDTLGEEARAAVATLHALQSLNLYDCQEQEPGEFERCNREVWHIPDFVAPSPGGLGESMIIEVDPEYMQ